MLYDKQSYVALSTFSSIRKYQYNNCTEAVFCSPILTAFCQPSNRHHRPKRTKKHPTGLDSTRFRSMILSCNSFLSANKEQHAAMQFVQYAMEKSTGVMCVIFNITIDPSKISTSNNPFAIINSNTSISTENEILFTMHTIFRVSEIKQMVNNSRLWEVELPISGEQD
ncbi:unnamed protein product [Rotaria socialis]